MHFCHLLTLFFKINFFKNSYREIIRVSNGLGPHLGPNCLLRIKQIVKVTASKERVTVGSWWDRQIEFA